jgi:hypothetical protein
MKLSVIRPFEALALPGIGAARTLTIEPGKGSFADWFAHVRGPSVFLVSPPGFMQEDGSPRRRVYEFPRAHCHLGWDVNQADQPPTSWSPPCAVCEQPLGISEGPMCRACDEKKHGMTPSTPPTHQPDQEPSIADPSRHPADIEPADKPAEKGPKKR